MAILPSKIQDLVNFGTMHWPVWQTNAAAIGLTVPQSTAFKNAATDLAAKFTDVNNAREAFRVAVVAQNTSMGAFRTIAAEDLALIKAFAMTQANPTVVYNLAQIPPPAAPGPVAAPGQPKEITATLDGTGSVTLKWKCGNPPGGQVAYIVERRTATSGTGSAFSFAGVAGTRSFTD